MTTDKRNPDTSSCHRGNAALVEQAPCSCVTKDISNKIRNLKITSYDSSYFLSDMMMGYKISSELYQILYKNNIKAKPETLFHPQECQAVYLERSVQSISFINNSICFSGL